MPLAEVCYTTGNSQFNIPNVQYENGVLTFEPGYGVGIEEAESIAITTPFTENRTFVSKTIDPETGVVVVETAAAE